MAPCVASRAAVHDCLPDAWLVGPALGGGFDPACRVGELYRRGPAREQGTWQPGGGLNVAPRILAALVLVTFLGIAPAASAGIYDPGGQDELTKPLRSGKEVPFDVFREALVNAARAADALQSEREPRKGLLERRTTLRKNGLAHLSPGQLTELGVIHVRLREANAAVEALRRALDRNPRDFWAHTSLGTAYQVSGQSAEAIRYLEASQDFPPEQAWANAVGYDQAWVRTVERAQLRLLRLRLRESGGRPPSRQGLPTNVDELFPARFVGPSGAYEAGTIAEVEQAKLPADAVAIVQQLLLWTPEDTRLYWLLGELYNARGDVTAADAIFDECIWSRRYDTPALREHRRAVKQAIADRAPPPAPDWKPSTGQSVTVGVFAGLVLCALGYFQVRQLVRRRPLVPPSARE